MPSAKQPNYNFQPILKFLHTWKMTDTVKIRKVGSRNPLFGVMKYKLRFSTPSQSAHFVQVFDWSQKNWGITVDDVLYAKQKSDAVWSFRMGVIGTDSKKDKDSVLYLKSDKELTLFQLRWK